MDLRTSMNNITEMQSSFQNFPINESTAIDVAQNTLNKTNAITYFVGTIDKNILQTHNNQTIPERNRPISSNSSKMKGQETEDKQSAEAKDNLDEILLNLENPYQKYLVVSDSNNDEYNFTLVNENNDDNISRSLQSNDWFENDNIDNEKQLHQNLYHLHEEIYKCSYCNYTSKNKYVVIQHEKEHLIERPYKCSVCEKCFTTKATLQHHENIHTDIKPYRCKDCNAGFNSSSEVMRHTKYKHTYEKPHKCNICDYASVESSKLKIHMRIHTGEKPYQCTHCSYASPDSYKLKRHLRVHTGEKPYTCNICASSFTQSNSLKSHMLTHNKERIIFQCEYCPKTYTRKTDLRIHVQRLHTFNKVLQCECGELFSDQHNYELHIKTHQGEKCYKCHVCPYAATSEELIKTHMLVHTDETPYECEVCKQRFCQISLLKQHYNIHHNPNDLPPSLSSEKKHKCLECGQSFKHVGNLVKHKIKHDPNSDFEEQQRALKLDRKEKEQVIEYQEDDLLTRDASKIDEQCEDMETLKQFFIINNNDYSI